jgi:hypothetical protein
MQEEDSRKIWPEGRLPQDMSWVERLLAEATWRYRVKHWTKPQRRQWVVRQISARNPPPDQTWVGRYSDEMEAREKERKT